MGLTLSYGYVKPQAGDRGTTAFFTPMEQNIQRLNDHTHDGTNSAPLPAQSISGVSQAISAGSWVTYGGPTGFFRQQITVPAGFDFDKVQISFRTTGGMYVFPDVEKISATQYYIYTNDSSQGFTAIYGG